jgi:hypothetical protein
MKDDIVTIPFVAHESAMNRMERANRRLWIVILVMFISFMVYLLIPNEIIQEDTSQSVEDITSSEIHQTIGE